MVGGNLAAVIPKFEQDDSNMVSITAASAKPGHLFSGARIKISITDRRSFGVKSWMDV